MAPVSATGTGVPRQRIDDPALSSLLARLARFDPRSSSAGGTAKDADAGGRHETGEGRKSPPLDVDGLVAELGAVGKWRFQEQVSRIMPHARDLRADTDAGEFTRPREVALLQTRVTRGCLQTVHHPGIPSNAVELMPLLRPKLCTLPTKMLPAKI